MYLAIDPHPSVPKRFEPFQRKPSKNNKGNPQTERFELSLNGDIDEDFNNLFVKEAPYINPPKLDSQERWLGLDVWHVTKNLGKTLIAAGNKAECSIINLW